MLYVTCDTCNKPAHVLFTDGGTACREHAGGPYPIPDDFGQVRSTMGVVTVYDEHDKYVGVVPRLPLH